MKKNKNIKLKNAVVYISANQGPNGGDVCQCRQQKAIKKYAEINGYDIRQTYKDTGYNLPRLERVQLANLILDGRNREFKILIVGDLTRLSRDKKKAKRILKEIKKNGVDVKFVIKGEVNSKSSKYILYNLDKKEYRSEHKRLVSKINNYL